MTVDKMRILALSIGPIAPDMASGGATKCLLDIAHALSKRGHQINILGPKRPNLERKYVLNSNLCIHATLPYRESFPSAYDIPPFNNVQMIQEIDRFQKESDIIYVHDAGFLYHDWFNAEIPLIVSLRDLLYQESILGAMSFRRDSLIVNSTYLYDCVMATIGNVISGLGKRISIIENGIDFSVFRPGIINKHLNKSFSKSLIKHPILLHPHRPDPRKGFPFVLEVIRKLKCIKGFDSVTLVVPSTSPDGQYSTQNIPLDLKKHIVSHKWLARSMMPAYYGLGDVTLCLGEFVEAFGSNIAIESLACGVPVVQTKVAAHRNTLPEGITYRVNPGNIDAAVEAIYVAVKNGKSCCSTWREVITDKFSLKTMIDSYETLFKNANVLSPLKVKHHPVKNNECLSLRFAPWCFIDNGRIYNDYLGTWFEHSQTEKIIKIIGENSTIRKDILDAGVKNDLLDQLINEGYLVIDYVSNPC